eukprot:gnl/TRDRNA2_/TRDRNA2_132442_c0_seq5.p1 gnl/TRDRNA2_/TRDRNA2_132442_c0~~gnl/TRDRNA2_/TRDRNA2_132442_c0_seq5.p1  ORF type:complete len:709 (+),score=293.89 gnl/TRDRNA2_/TRDRNA2_132442_c0_seq5:85-2211(+)
MQNVIVGCNMYAICITSLLLTSAVDAAQITPIQKVIGLLKDLETEISKDGAKEAAEYDQFACFCKNQAGFKAAAVAKSEEKIEVLEADIKDLEAEIDELNGDIEKLGEKIDELAESIKKDQEKRDEEHEEYLEEEKEIAGAVSSVGRAIASMKDSKAFAQVRSAAKQALSLMSRSSKIHVKDSTAMAVKAIAEKEPGEAHDYEFHGGEILETLADLQKTYKKNKKDLDADEFERMAEHQKKKLAEENEKKFAEKEKQTKEDQVAEHEETLADKKQSKEDEEKAAKSDKEFIEELTKQCEDRADEFDQRSKARAGELTAISQAISTLEDGVQPNAGANKKLTGLVGMINNTQVEGHWYWVRDEGSEAAATSKTPSFLQVRSVEAAEAGAKKKAAEVLRNAGDKFKDRLLSGLAVKVELSEDHFVKVRGLIKDLIQKLKDDAEAEADQKGFCDTEMEKALELRDESNLNIESESAKISAKTSAVAELTEEIDTLVSEIAELNKAVNEATDMRAAEKATNSATLATAKAGLKAVESALDILKGFYDNAALAQMEYKPPKSGRDGKTVGDMAPSESKGEYKGKQGASKGIIGLLEVIQSDFERTIETVEKDEEKAQKKFDEFVDESKKSMKDKDESKKDKQKEVKTTEGEISEAKDNKADAHDQLEIALAELEKLKPMCVDGGETYEQRKKKREEEIASLKEAMQILIDWQK